MLNLILFTLCTIAVLFLISLLVAVTWDWHKQGGKWGIWTLPFLVIVGYAIVLTTMFYQEAWCGQLL